MVVVDLPAWLMPAAPPSVDVAVKSPTVISPEVLSNPVPETVIDCPGDAVAGVTVTERPTTSRLKEADFLPRIVSVMTILWVPVAVPVGTTNLNGVRAVVSPVEGNAVTLLLVVVAVPTTVLVVVFRVARGV
jgi:hypothetical protein